ncbi:hypothetical protein [Formosa sp. A9]|uniref:hypothetical protein n=1 Tax=Formosa sp. A9 TaxID=3442641 RepID=UPI003EBEACC2
MIDNFGDKVNTNGFDKRPEDTNKGGRKPSIKNQMIELLESNGEMIIQPENVIKIEDNGSVRIKIATEMQLAMKLNDWAMSKKGSDSLKALQIILETIDGKAKQSVDVTSGNKPISSVMGKRKIIIQEFNGNDEV